MPTYSINKHLLPDVLKESFIEFSEDSATQDFIIQQPKKSLSFFKSIFESLLSLILPAYEVEGLLRLEPMYLLSEEQWRLLLKEKIGGVLLDVGAGQGFMTSKAKSIFKKIYTTETSHSLARRLRQQGFECFEKDLGETISFIDQRFDAISFLNVLDRCDYPLSLLKNCISLLKPNGYLLIASPLPLYPYVRKVIYNKRPRQSLPQITSEIWEECLIHFYEQVIQKNNLEVVRWTRLPYVWKGTGNSYIESFDDVVMVCRKT